MGGSCAADFQLGQRAGADDLLHRHLRALLQMQLAGFDARHLHHFGGQLVQPVGLFVDDGQQLAVGIRTACPAGW
jgi:hypothetical protein